MPRTFLAFVCAVAVCSSLRADAPQVVVTDPPNGMAQVVGGSFATDSFTLANAGPGDASISISIKNNFFSVSPSSFTLPEGQSQTVSIRSTTQNGGISDGTASIFIAGVAQPLVLPIRLFAGSQPAGIVSPVPSGAITVSGLPGQQHSGQINISNRGNVGMQGILVGSSPWIVPQSDLVGIPSNGSARGPFVVDSSRRPDGSAPLGAIAGSLSLVYLNGTGNTTSMESTIAAAPPSSRVSVSVLDVSKPNTAPGLPPSLAPGELAVFLSGVSGRGGATTDLYLSNRATTSIADVKLYYTGITAPPSAALLAPIANLGANINAWFPSAPQLLFNAFGSTGTLQVRNGAIANISLEALLSISPDLNNFYTTVVPLLRSDRGASSRLFAGVEKSAGRHTNMSIQEVSGNAATATIDFFDANGAAIGAPRTESLPAFGFTTLEDVAPAGAASARITAGGAGKIDGYATVVDEVTLDSYVITDPTSVTAGPDDVLIAPIPPLPSTASVDVFVTGPGSASVIGGGRRRRAVRSHAVGTNESVTSQAAQATQRFTYAAGTAGYLRVTGAPGTFSGSARVTLNRAGGGSFGGAIPLRRESEAIAAGASRRVSGIDDPKNGPHPSLTLIETLGSPATVRVTVQYTFNASVTATGQVTAAKNFGLNGGQVLTVDDIVGTIGGAGRASVGNLVRVVVDVAVTSGSGRVLPFVRTIDATSGDVTIVTE